MIHQPELVLSSAYRAIVTACPHSVHKPCSRVPIRTESVFSSLALPNRAVFGRSGVCPVNPLSRQTATMRAINFALIKSNEVTHVARCRLEVCYHFKFTHERNAFLLHQVTTFRILNCVGARNRTAPRGLLAHPFQFVHKEVLFTFLHSNCRPPCPT